MEDRLIRVCRQSIGSNLRYCVLKFRKCNNAGLTLALHNHGKIIYKELNTWKNESSDSLICSVVDSDEILLAYLNADKIPISKLFVFKKEEARILGILEKVKKNSNKYQKAHLKINKKSQ